MDGLGGLGGFGVDGRILGSGTVESAGIGGGVELLLPLPTV